MAQITMVNGRAVKAQLPAFLGPEAYMPIEGFAEWWQRMQDRYEWCKRCGVARLAAHHAAHKIIHSRNRKGWNAGHYEIPQPAEGQASG